MTNARTDASETKTGQHGKSTVDEKVGWEDVSSDIFAPPPHKDNKDQKEHQDPPADSTAASIATTNNTLNLLAQSDGPPAAGGDKGKTPQPKTEQELRALEEARFKEVSNFQTNLYKKPTAPTWYEYLTGSSHESQRRVQSPGMSRTIENAFNIDLTALSNRLESSVISVSVSKGEQGGGGAGTAFPVTSGDVSVVVTNDHVTDGAKDITIKWEREHGHIREARTVPLLANKVGDDLALLPYDANQMPGLRTVKLDTSPPVPGEQFVSIGHPFGLSQKIISVGNYISTDKNVAVQGGRIESEIFYTSNQAHGGNSGGPLFSKIGKVRGVTTVGQDVQVDNESTPNSGAVPAKRVEDFIAEAQKEGKIKPAGALPGWTEFYNGVDFTRSEEFTVDSANGDLRASFVRFKDSDPSAALITKSGETRAAYETAIVNKDSRNFVTGADTLQGTPIYRVERDESGGITKLTKFSANGQPGKILVREGQEQNPHREALISNARAREVSAPPKGAAKLSDLEMAFNKFHQVNAAGQKTGSSERMNINITADGIIRTEVPSWNYMLSDNVIVNYDAPQRNYFNATENSSSRTIKHADDVTETLDKTAGKTTLTWQTQRGPGSLCDVTEVTKTNGNLWAASDHKVVLFPADGKNRLENNGNLNAGMQVYDRHTNKLVATTDVRGNPEWRFDKTAVTSVSGQSFKSPEWDISRPALGTDGSVTIKSTDGKGVARLLPGNESVIERDGFSTHQYENGATVKSLGNMIVEVRTAPLGGKPGQAYEPVYENKKLVALKGNNQRIDIKPAGADYHFDSKTGALTTAPGSSTEFGVPAHYRWEPGTNNYVVEKENQSKPGLNIYSFDTALLNAKPASPAADASPANATPNPRFRNLETAELQTYVSNKTVPPEAAKEAFQEIVKRHEVMLGPIETSLKALDTVLPLLKAGKEPIAGKDGKVTPDPKNPLTEARRMEFHGAVFGDIDHYRNLLVASREYAHFLDNPAFKGQDAERKLAKEKAAKLTAPYKGVDGKPVDMMTLMAREAKQMRLDAAAVSPPNREALLRGAQEIEAILKGR